jgi:quercetin dioxygenase-like cupin family protein
MTTATTTTTATPTTATPTTATPTTDRPATAAEPQAPGPTTVPYVRRAGGTAPTGPATVWFQGCTFTFLAEAADTGGAFAVLEIEARRGFEPPPHTHLHGDQAFYVAAGDVTFRCGDSMFPATAGDYVHLPAGLEHSFEIHTETARFLVVDVPGGSEEVFRRFAEPAGSLDLPPVPEPPSDELVAAMVAADGEHGIVYPEPPPA